MDIDFVWARFPKKKRLRVQSVSNDAGKRVHLVNHTPKFISSTKALPEMSSGRIVEILRGLQFKNGQSSRDLQCSLRAWWREVGGVLDTHLLPVSGCPNCCHQQVETDRAMQKVGL